MNKQWHIAILLSLGLITTTAPICAANVVPVGRYLTVSTKPSTSQLNLLSQMIQVRFPLEVLTVGDAIHYLLQLSGYSLIADNKRENALKIILSKPLPLIDRALGPMALQDGLKVLVGPAFYLHKDLINRTINFRLRKNFANAYKTKNTHIDKE